MVCAVCQTPNPTGAKYCHRCGARLGLICEACGFGNLPEARFCNDCGARLTAEPAQPEPAGAPASGQDGPPGLIRAELSFREERRPCTMLFADLVGFTALADQLDPEEARELTAIALGRLAREATELGGTIDKFIGDAILVLFGAPVAHEDDAERAVGAALAMLRAIGELNDTLAAPRGLQLAVRIGINRGQVVVGLRDLGGHSEYTAIGDPVNVAARLQAEAQPGTILVGESVFREANRVYAFVPLEPLTLRGKPEPVAAFQVLGPLTPGRGQRSSAVEFSSPLVGREQELSSLRYCVDQIQRGRGQIAFVVGEPGLGKTRLIGELRQQTEGRGIQWAQARAVSYGQHLSYGMFNGTVRDIFQAEDFGGEQEAADSLRAYLQDLGAEEAYPFLLYQLGLPAEVSVQLALEQLAPSEFQARLLAAIRIWLCALARRRPLVCVVDDLHWTDPSSMVLLDGLLALADDVPIFFCFLLRAERESPAWQLKERAARDFPHRYTEVGLQPLSPAESAELLRNLVEAVAGHTQVRDLILSRTEGNPLFIEEVVRDLIERGALVQTPRGWDVGREIAEVHLPDSLQAAIIARIDRLREPLRHLIQTAAVIGRDFALPVLERVLGAHPSLDEDLRDAQRLELIREVDQAGSRAFRFRHPLVQEAVYQTLLVRDRRELHAAVARALEALASPEPDAACAELAEHYAGAEDWQRTAQFAVRAGDRAALTHANREALDYYRLACRALAHAPDALPEGAAAELFENMGDLEALVGLSDEAIESYQGGLLHLARLGEDGRAVGRLNLKLARVAMLRQDPAGSETYLDAAFAALPLGDPQLSSGWSVRSWLQIWQNDYDAAAESAERALELAREGGDFADLNEAYSALAQSAIAALPGRDDRQITTAWITAARERHDSYALATALSSAVVNQLWIRGVADYSSLEAAREALELAESVGAEVAARSARYLLAGCLHLDGRWSEAEAEMDQAAALEQDVDRLDLIGAFLRGSLLTDLGRLERARGLLEGALGSLGFPHSQIWLNQALALNRQAAGEPAASRVALQRAGEAAERLGCQACAAFFSGVAAELWVELGDRTRAERYIAQARDLAGRLGRRPTLLAASRAEARLLLLEGRAERATRQLRALYRLAREVGVEVEVARTALRYGQALAQLPRPSDQARARQYVWTAIGMLESLGARIEAERARDSAEALSLAGAVVAAGR